MEDKEYLYLMDQIQRMKENNVKIIQIKTESSAFDEVGDASKYKYQERKDTIKHTLIVDYLEPAQKR